MISVMAIDSGDIVAKAKEIHNTSHVCTAALGRLLTASAIMASTLKGDDDSITLKINGGGETGTVTAVAHSNGHVKGDIANPSVKLPLRNDGHLNVGAAVGKNGFLTVIEDLGLEKPYVGQVPIYSGEIADDVTYYYAQSEQIPTVCGLGVLVTPDTGDVIVSGGFMIQLLPNATEEIIETVENDIKNIEPVTKMLADGLSPEQICKKILPSTEFTEIGRSFPIYKCDCSREKVENALITLGKKELLKMAFDKETEVTCHFCGKKYHFSSDEIRKLAENLS